MKDFSVFSMDFSGFFREFSARKDAEISKMTTFGVGGRAALAVYPESVARLAEVVAFAAKSDVPVLVLGGGSNVLVSDAGFSGIVIRAGGVLRGILPCRGGFWAAAGTYLGEIFRFSRDNDLGGFEFLRSIPGAVGASVVGNAGCFGGEIAKRAKIVQALDLKKLAEFFGKPRFCGTDGFFGETDFSAVENTPSPRELRGNEAENFLPENELATEKNPTAPILPESDIREAVRASEIFFDGEALAPQYRRTALSGGRFLVTRVFFEGVGSFDAGFADYVARKRAETQPRGCKTAGSVFLRDGDFSPAKAIDDLGLKGLRVGGAYVHPRHAGFIANRSDASASDVLELIGILRRRVYEAFGRELRTEINYVGDGAFRLNQRGIFGSPVSE